jgi:hypothetical protein
MTEKELQRCLEERRARIVAVSPKEILALLFEWNHDAYISLPLLAGLPKDRHVGDCFYAMDRAAFGIVIYHISFQPCPPGSTLPWQCADIDIVKLPIARPAETPERNRT